MYEKEKRPDRFFNQKWKDSHPWPFYNDKMKAMTCTICVDYAKQTSSNNLKYKYFGQKRASK
jgi:hypothetical protein